MNEKIEKLAEEAGFVEGWFSESGDDCEREIKKFAELIVQECVDVIDVGGEFVSRPKMVERLKQHFGVEE